MKERLLNFASYIFIGLTILGYTMFRAGLESENWLFFLIGVVLLAFGGILLLIKIIANRRAIKLATTELKNARENFKNDSNKFLINLNEIEIRTPLRSEVIGIDEYTYLESDGLENSENLNAYILEFKLDEQVIEYPIKTRRDSATLTMLFSNQKETTLHVGKTVSSIRYLDLEFLD